ncbi:hypothetical protein LINGRAHAP2_LOCUS20964 [Linum grandiflorum]
MSKLFSVLDACIISIFDTEINRRPYHRNCDCALHKKKGYNKESNGGSTTRRPCLRRSVTFPIDKKTTTTTKMNQRCRASWSHCADTKNGVARDDIMAGEF